MEQTKPKAGLNKWVFLGVIVAIIAIAGFMFSDMFADIRTTLALMLMTGAIVYMWGRRKNKQMLSSSEVAHFIANSMVRDKDTLKLDPSANNVHVEETGIDRVMVCFIREIRTFTYSRTDHKILESFPGYKMHMVHEMRQDSVFMAKRDDMAIRLTEKQIELENEGM